MASKKFIGVLLMGLAGLSLPAVIASTSASADEATTGTSIVTEELCTWYMLGAPAEISLTPTGGAVEYVGDVVPVSAAFAGEDDLNVYSSGNVTRGDRTTFEECTFYSSPTRPIVTVSISDDAFTATALVGGPDTSMDFEAMGANEFMVDATDALCGSPWTVINAELLGEGAALSEVLTTIATVEGVDDRVTSTNDRCATDLTFSINIPEGMTPVHAGQTYNWEGPGFTTALSTSTSGA
jgi:hypothetical protein